MYPADLAVVDDERGRARLTRVDRPDDSAIPAISIAHAEGVSVAIAVRTPGTQVGIDVVTIADRPEDFESTAFTPGERALLDQRPPRTGAEWVARFCVRQGKRLSSRCASANPRVPRPR